MNGYLMEIVHEEGDAPDEVRLRFVDETAQKVILKDGAIVTFDGYATAWLHWLDTEYLPAKEKAQRDNSSEDTSGEVQNDEGEQSETEYFPDRDAGEREDDARGTFC